MRVTTKFPRQTPLDCIWVSRFESDYWHSVNRLDLDRACTVFPGLADLAEYVGGGLDVGKQM